MPRTAVDNKPDNMEIIELKDKEDNSIKFVHAKGWLKDKIVIHRQEGPGGISSVFLQVNNFPVLIPREVECDLPKPLVQALKDAVKTETFRDEQNVEFTRDVLRFNLTVIAENVNWAAIMNNDGYARMNEEYLRSVGKWNKART